MLKTWDVSRRKFLGVLGATTLIRGGEPMHTMAMATPSQPTTVAYKALQPSQVELLGAIADQIIPPDQDLGAREAGAVRYIDSVLAGEQGDKSPLYVVGLEGTDQTAQLVYGQDFVKLTSEQQIAVLASLENGTAQGEVWRSFSSQEFFAMVWQHVLEGYYGPPQDGGNKGFASWKMIGFPEHSGAL